MDKPDPVEQVESVYQFLQGEVPEGWKVPDPPRLTPEQAWTAVWFLQEGPRVLPDHIGRCQDCGELFDTHTGGLYAEKTGKSYCDECQYEHRDEIEEE